MFLNRHRAEKRGFTLTEMAIVLAVMGTVLGAIWLAAARVNANNKARKASEQVITIGSAYKQLFKQGPSAAVHWKEITDIGVANGVFPDDMIVGGLPFNPWAGRVLVYDATNPATSGAWGSIVIRYEGLSQRACNLVANAIINPLAQPYAEIGNGPATSTGIAQLAAPGTNPMGTALLPSVSDFAQAGCQANNNTNWVRVMIPVL
jgi:prepilin-type N-terminal cleavage/methylation domain-containing protein